MRNRKLAPIVSVISILMVGCTTSADPPEHESPSTATPPIEESRPSDADGAEPAAWDVVPSNRAPLLRGDEGPPRAEARDADEAAKEAKATVEAFFATDEVGEWWPNFSQHLSPAAQEVWQYTDPRRLPEGNVRGAVAAGPVSATDAEMAVPSTLGEFQLVLVRDSAEDLWRVSAIEPPQEAQRP